MKESWAYSAFIVVVIVSIGLYIVFSVMMLDATERNTKAHEEVNRIRQEHLECYRRGECKNPP